MASKCDICGSVHESWQAHVFSDPGTRKGQAQKVKAEIEERVASGVTAMSIVMVECACGCGREIEVAPRYATGACRQRAKRARDARSRES